MIFNKAQEIKPSLSNDIIRKYAEATSNDGLICRAPFTSLYFHPNGDIGACCLNYNKVSYGKYPQNSIEEIIKSASRLNHQNHLRNNNLNLACNTCQDILKAEVFTNLLATGYDNQNIKPHITRMDFELSYKCNLKCVMCDLHSEKDNNSIYSDSFIDEITPHLKNLEYANFIGGEPFVIGIYYKIWDRILAVNSNCIINIQTNGTIFNKKVEDVIASPQVSLVVSIDSLNADRYATIRKGGNVNTSLKNIQIFKDTVQKRNSNLQLSVCPMRNNWIDMPEIIEFSNKNNCIVYFNQVEYPIELSLKYIPSENLGTIIKFYKSELQKLSDNCKDCNQETKKIKRNNLDSFHGLIKILENWRNQNQENEKNTVSLSKSDIEDLLKPLNSENYEGITSQLKTSLPDKWEVSSIRHIEIINTDFKERVDKMRDSGISDSQIIQTAKNFFELTKTDNLYHE